MFTISWYWPWNNKIRKIIIVSLFMCSLVSGTLGGSHFWDFCFQPHQEFYLKTEKKKLRHSAGWKKYQKVLLGEQQKWLRESCLNSQRLAALSFLSCGPYCKFENHKHAPTEFFLIFRDTDHQKLSLTTVIQCIQK